MRYSQAAARTSTTIIHISLPPSICWSTFPMRCPLAIVTISENPVHISSTTVLAISNKTANKWTSESGRSTMPNVEETDLPQSTNESNQTLCYRKMPWRRRGQILPPSSYCFVIHFSAVVCLYLSKYPLGEKCGALTPDVRIPVVSDMLD